MHPFVYHRPTALGEAVDLLAEHAGDVMPIAGGTDLVPNMKHKLFTPGHLVSLRRIPEMQGIERVDGGLRIGACASLDAVASSQEVKARLPALARACGLVSGPQLRRMGTIGGNVCLDTRCTYYNQTRFWREALGYCLKKDGDTCHVIKGGTRCVAAHSADSPPVLIVADAELRIVGPDGERTVSISDFFTSDGVWNRRMEPNELLVSVLVPTPAPRTRVAFEKLRPRESIDFPLLNLAVAAELDDEERVTRFRLVASAMGAYPRKLGRMEETVLGNRLSPSVVDAVARQAFRQCHPLDNITVDPEWRRAMVPVLVRRALKQIAAPPA